MVEMRSATVAALVILVLSASRLSGQALHELDAEGARWHSALRLKAALEADPRQPAAILRLAVLELSLGRPEKARALLTRDSGRSIWPDEIVVPLLASAEYQLERFEMAAELFEQSAALVRGRQRGVFLARAGLAREKAGQRHHAARLYRMAAEELSDISGWLALRQARMGEDTASALALLKQAPEAAVSLSLEARATILLAAGDTAGAVTPMAEAGMTAAAAFLALASGDTLRARDLAYKSVASRDTSLAKEGIDLAVSSLRPQTADEYLTLGRAYRRTGSVARAVGAVEQAVRLDSSDTEILVYWADLLEESGPRDRALEVYRRAAARGDEAAEVAAFKFARLLFRMRRYQPAIAALEAFADSFPENSDAPVALYLVGNGYTRTRRRAAADSTYAAVSRRWPRDMYASRSRLLLATHLLDSGDTAKAVEWYRVEVEVGGQQRFYAQYRAATLSRDSLEARGILAVLARADSIGYYGTIARMAAGLPPLNVIGYEKHPISQGARKTLSELDLLRESLLQEEVDALLDHILSASGRPPVELLDLAEGLIDRGYMSQAISLGWRATRAYTLNHPRVLRVIFPWPHREIIEQEAKEQGLDPYVLAGLIRQESAFRAEVVSRAGAYGLMQLMPPTARQVANRLGLEWDQRWLDVPDANLHLGATHFGNLLRRYGGDVVPALAAYNAGGTPVRRWLRVPEARDPIQFVELVPYPETQGYLRTVIRNRALYRALYPRQESATTGNP
jgi:soluble lytic murein transglycosylase